MIYVILTFDICHSFDIHRFDLQYASFLDTVGSRYPENETLLYMSFSINALFCLEPISTYIEDLDIGIKNEKLGLVIKTNSDDETPLSNLLAEQLVIQNFLKNDRNVLVFQVTNSSYKGFIFGSDFWKNWQKVNKFDKLNS